MNKHNKCKILNTRSPVHTVTAIDYDTDLDQVYTTSTLPCSVQILDRKSLTLAKRKIYLSFLYPQNVIVRGSKIFVLDCNNPCLHALSKSTHQLYNLFFLMEILLTFRRFLKFSKLTHIVGSFDCLNPSLVQNSHSVPLAVY